MTHRAWPPVSDDTPGLLRSPAPPAALSPSSPAVPSLVTPCPHHIHLRFSPGGLFSQVLISELLAVSRAVREGHAQVETSCTESSCREKRGVDGCAGASIGEGANNAMTEHVSESDDDGSSYEEDSDAESDEEEEKAIEQEPTVSRKDVRGESRTAYCCGSMHLGIDIECFHSQMPKGCKQPHHYEPPCAAGRVSVQAVQSLQTAQTATQKALPSKLPQLSGVQSKEKSTVIGKIAKGPATKAIGNLADILEGECSDPGRPVAF